MKANELMLGDLVFAEGKPVQVTNLSMLGGDIICVMNPIMSYDIVYASNIVALSKGAKDINMIEPISITSSLLEKNGFKISNFEHIDGQHQWTWWLDTLSFISLWCRELKDDPSDGWMVRIESPFVTCTQKIEFVHELQHILKGSKFKKDIIIND